MMGSPKLLSYQGVRFPASSAVVEQGMDTIRASGSGVHTSAG